MTNKKSTQRALLSSVIAMLICIAMLIGTTFAWFTDTATSAVNKIMAGNLDVEVDYVSEFNPDGSPKTWASIQNVGTLFDPNTLWEPGHTEVVYLKISNNGSLAFNYKMKVTPISETGGINAAGESFKLSDYLVFKTSDPSASFTALTRDTARTFAGTTMALNQEGLTKVGSISAGDPAQYITLVVYMPEDVGNEANYKTGTTPPEIELGITCIATQKTEESDSFGNDYDADAVTDVDDYVVGPTYSYFPQVKQTAAISKSGSDVTNTSGDSNVTVDGSGNVKINSAAQVEGVPAVIIEIPQGALKTGDSNPGIQVAKTDATAAAAAAAASSNKNIAAFEISTIDLPKDSSGNLLELVTVKLFVGKGLDGVEVYHNGVKMTMGVSYDAVTGYVTITSSSFSPFDILYNKAAARIDSTVYGSLKSAIAAFNSATEEKAYTIVLFNGTYTESDLVIFQDPNLPGKTLAIKAQTPKGVTIMPNDDGATDRIFLISALSSYTGGSVTFEGIKFDISDKGGSAFYLGGGGSGNIDKYITNLYGGAAHRYTHDITIKNCEFVGDGTENTKAVESAQSSSAAGIVIDNCVGTDLGYLAEGYYDDYAGKISLTIKNSTVNNAKAMVNNQGGASTTVVENCTVSAYHDYIIRSNGTEIIVKNSSFNSTYSGSEPGGVIACRSSNRIVTVQGCTFNKASANMYDVFNVSASSTTINGSNTLTAGQGYNFN